jgi:hypothetical protein
MYRNNEYRVKAQGLEAQIKTKLTSMLELAVEIRNLDMQINELRTGRQPALFGERSYTWDALVEIARRYKINI